MKKTHNVLLIKIHKYIYLFTKKKLCWSNKKKPFKPKEKNQTHFSICIYFMSN